VRTVPVLILFAVLQSACSSGGALSPKATSTDSGTPPKPFVDHVESQWKGASLAARSTTSCSPSATASAAVTSTTTDAQAALVAGDFDGDGAKDVAAAVKRDDGLHVVVGLQHTYDYEVVDVTDKADPSADRVTVRARGTRYTLPDSDVDYYFGADTIVLTPCGAKPTAYLWNGEGFEAQPLAQ